MGFVMQKYSLLSNISIPFYFLQQISKIDARGHLIRRLKSFQSPKQSFASTSGREMYFNAHQDVNGAYDLVNLNVSIKFIH